MGKEFVAIIKCPKCKVKQQTFDDNQNIICCECGWVFPKDEKYVIKEIEVKCSKKSFG